MGLAVWAVQATDDVSVLRHVVTPNEIELNVLAKYSQEGCYFECLMKQSTKLCGCIPWQYPQMSGIPMCSLFKAQCFQMTMQDRRFISNCTSCLPNCDIHYFDVRL